MALGRLSARNGHAALSKRVATLELQAGASDAQYERDDVIGMVWQLFPEPVRCLLAHGREGRRYDFSRWAAQALVDRLDVAVCVAGWTLREAYHWLAWHHIRARGGRTWGSASDDSAPAAQELLGTTESHLHELWGGDPNGVEWCRLWREQGTYDPLTLERAGLDASALWLLDTASGSVRPHVTACELRHDLSGLTAPVGHYLDVALIRIGVLPAG